MTQNADIREDTALNVKNIREALSDQNYEQALKNSRIDRNFWNQYRPAWNQTAAGRLAARLISRGVMGAAFYVIGGHYAAKHMDVYDPSKRPSGVYQWLAYSIDKYISHPIELGMNRINGNGKSFVSFRPTLKNNPNRSLGEEVIRGNADFAMASMGDALGREMLGVADEIRRKAWHDERGNLSGSRIAKSFGGSLLRVFTAQFPDWFVSVPYAFQQKFQRKVLNHFFPGFEAAGDSTLHGANHRIKDGKPMGTYALPATIDLQARFTGYNFGTGVWQDIWKTVGKKINKNGQEEDQPKRSFIKRSAEYLTVRTVKTLLIMTPSIPLFSLFRVPQGRHRGLAIDSEKNTIIHEELKGVSGYNMDKNGGNRIDKLTNPFGKAAYTLSSKAMRIIPVSQERKELVENWTNASLAYTPYIYAKNELQHHFDTPEMDGAILKMVKNTMRGHFGEAKEGLVDITQAMRPKAPPPPHVEVARHAATPQDIIASRQNPEERRQSIIERQPSSATERVTKNREGTAEARIAAGV